MNNLHLDIEKLIPHRGRMKLIDNVLDINANTAVTLSLVSDQWPLFNGSSVDPIILIELVAQTAGVHISWTKGGYEGGGTGWIVGIKSADFFLYRIPLFTPLITTVNNLYCTENYNVLEGNVTSGDDILGRIQIQVFRSEAG